MTAQDLMGLAFDGGGFLLLLGIHFRLGNLSGRVTILENRLKFKLLEA